MFTYDLSLTINDSVEVLSHCRIDNDKSVFTKNITALVNTGDKLSLKRPDGYTTSYVVTQTPDKINLLGSREFRVSRI